MQTNPQSKTDSKQPLNVQHKTSALRLIDDTDGKKIILAELYRRFSVYKVFGKEPESFENYISVIVSDCKHLPTEKILKAIITHSQRSNEPPTPADIIGLVKRNGRPPIKESEIIAIRKKAGEDRTTDEWEMLKEWEEQQTTGWGSDYSNPEKDTALLQENIQLRKKIHDLQKSYDELASLLRSERMQKGIIQKPPTLKEKIQRTAEDMKAQGKSQEEIDEFLESVA